MVNKKKHKINCRYILTNVETKLNCVRVTGEKQMCNDGGQKKKSDSGKVLLEEVNEAIGRWVVGVDLCGILQLSLDLLCQLFAQFHSENTHEEVTESTCL